MKDVLLNLGQKSIQIKVPDSTDILTMGKASLLFNSEEKIRGALANPIDCPPLRSLVQEKLKANPQAKAVIVISDNILKIPSKALLSLKVERTYIGGQLVYSMNASR